MSNYVCIATQKFEQFEQRANKNVEHIFAATFCKQRLLWIIVQTTSKELIRKRKQTLSVKRSHSFIYLLNVLICCFIKHNVDRFFFLISTFVLRSNLRTKEISLFFPLLYFSLPFLFYLLSLDYSFYNGHFRYSNFVLNIYF